MEPTVAVGISIGVVGGLFLLSGVSILVCYCLRYAEEDEGSKRLPSALPRPYFEASRTAPSLAAPVFKISLS